MNKSFCLSPYRYRIQAGSNELWIDHDGVRTKTHAICFDDRRAEHGWGEARAREIGAEHCDEYVTGNYFVLPKELKMRLRDMCRILDEFTVTDVLKPDNAWP